MNYKLSSSKRKTTDCARANFCDHFSLLPMWHLLLRCASNILNFARSRWIKNTNCLAESLMLHLSIAKHTQFLVEHHFLLWWINGLHIARCRPAFSVVWNYLNQDIRLVFPKSHLQIQTIVPSGIFDLCTSFSSGSMLLHIVTVPHPSFCSTFAMGTFRIPIAIARA